MTDNVTFMEAVCSFPFQLTLTFSVPSTLPGSEGHDKNAGDILSKTMDP